MLQIPQYKAPAPLQSGKEVQRITQQFLKVSSEIQWSKQVMWPWPTSRGSVLAGGETWKPGVRDGHTLPLNTHIFMFAITINY